MRQQFVITIDENTSREFALNFLRNVSFIKTIKPGKEERSEIDETTLMCEKALGEEWLSEEDNRWDKLL